MITIRDRPDTVRTYRGSSAHTTLPKPEGSLFHLLAITATNAMP
jgi:hypothetical protein